MEFEPMLTPREKSPLPKMSPEEDRTRDAVDSEPKHYQLSYSGPFLSVCFLAFFLSFFLLWSSSRGPSRKLYRNQRKHCHRQVVNRYAHWSFCCQHRCLQHPDYHHKIVTDPLPPDLNITRTSLTYRYHPHHYSTINFTCITTNTTTLPVTCIQPISRKTQQIQHE